MSYRESFRELVEILKSKGEDDLIKSVEETIRLCGQYVFKVNNMEGAFITADLIMESREYREYVNDLDADRHNTHEGLIPSVKLLNNICKMVEIEPIYKGNIENRVEIGDFALDVVSDLFQTRKL